MLSACELYEALRRVIPNLPADGVTRLRVDIPSRDAIPILDMTLECRDERGEIFVRPGTDEFATEARRFEIVPEGTLAAIDELLVHCQDVDARVRMRRLLEVA